jgi:hypothetical protein
MEAFMNIFLEIVSEFYKPGAFCNRGGEAPHTMLLLIGGTKKKCFIQLFLGRVMKSSHRSQTRFLCCRRGSYLDYPTDCSLRGPTQAPTVIPDKQGSYVAGKQDHRSASFRHGERRHPKPQHVPSQRQANAAQGTTPTGGEYAADGKPNISDTQPNTYETQNNDVAS